MHACLASHNTDARFNRIKYEQETIRSRGTIRSGVYNALSYGYAGGGGGGAGSLGAGAEGAVGPPPGTPALGE